MGYFEVLALPLRTFWAFNRQVDRLRAEEEQRQLRVFSAAQHPEATKSLDVELRSEMGTPVYMEKQFDADRFAELAERFAKGA